jgi:hypothetical protein
MPSYQTTIITPKLRQLTMIKTHLVEFNFSSMTPNTISATNSIRLINAKFADLYGIKFVFERTLNWMNPSHLLFKVIIIAFFMGKLPVRFLVIIEVFCCFRLVFELFKLLENRSLMNCGCQTWSSGTSFGSNSVGVGFLSVLVKLFFHFKLFWSTLIEMWLNLSTHQIPATYFVSLVYGLYFHHSTATTINFDYYANLDWRMLTTT